MKRTIDLDQIRVVQADNYKGNPRVYLEVMDQRILYSSPYELPEHYLNEDGYVDTEALADLFRMFVGSILAKLLLENYNLSDSDNLGVWRTSTDREIDYVKPRLEEES